MHTERENPPSKFTIVNMAAWLLAGELEYWQWQSRARELRAAEQRCLRARVCCVAVVIVESDFAHPLAGIHVVGRATELQHTAMPSAHHPAAVLCSCCPPSFVIHR